MRIAVVGAGPAGLTAAFRLQQLGHDVTVFEARDVVGGRTHTEHFGAGHWVDTGAGWLGSFYPRTLALLDELRLTELLRPMPLRGGGDLMIDGHVVPCPSSLRRIVTSPLLGSIDKARFLTEMARLIARQQGELATDLAYDDVPALDGLAGMGDAARERIVRPLFEGPFFSRLEEMSAALVRSWLRVLSVGGFFQVNGGMDAPWRRVGDLVGARTSTTVERVEPRGDHVDIAVGGTTEGYDGCVVAVPAPVAARLVSDAPSCLRRVRYAPHVRLYAARRAAGPRRSSIHVFPNDVVATVEIGSGRWGAWGAVPDDWCWALVCAPAAGSSPLLEPPAAEVTAQLWKIATEIDPRLFDLDRADIVHLVRWPHAVPVVDPGYYRRLAGLAQAPPVVYAGDWLVQPCVEGAVRSGEAAAALFGR
jgi:protoporphyrinogen oxidase